MQTLQELGTAVAARRYALGLKQGGVAQQAGITAELLSRFERGRCAEFGTRKLLAVLAVLGMELNTVVSGQSGTLDELRGRRQLSWRPGDNYPGGWGRGNLLKVSVSLLGL